MWWENNDKEHIPYTSGLFPEGEFEDNSAAKVHKPPKKDHFGSPLADTYTHKYTLVGVGSGGGLLDVVRTTKSSNDKPLPGSSMEWTEEHVAKSGVDRLPPTWNKFAPVIGTGNSPEFAEPLPKGHYTTPTKFDTPALIWDVPVETKFACLVALPKETAK